MAQYLLTYLQRIGDDYLRWAVCDDKSKSVKDHGHGGFADAAKAAERRKVVMVIAGTEVLLEEAAVPTTNLSKALKAVPYALEELLAQDIEASHFAFGNRLKNNHIPVAVIARDSMDWILAQCRQAKLNPQEIIPESLALPFHEGHSTIMTNSGHAAVRLSQSKGFSCDVDMLPMLLANVAEEPVNADLVGGDASASDTIVNDSLADTSNQEARTVSGSNGGKIIHHALHFVCGRDETVLDTLEPAIEMRTEVELFAHGLAQYRSRKNSAIINLLQSGYDKKESVGKAWKPWRVPAAMAATLLALWGGSAYLQYHELGLEEQRLRGEIVGTLKSTFPEIKRPENDPVRQMRSRVRQGKEGGIDHGSFVAMMSAIGAALTEIKDQPPSVKSLNYRSGKLDIEFEASSRPDVDKIKSRLEVEKKLSANVLSANKERDRIKARMRVESSS